MRYIAERGGAPVTEIQKAFDLSPEMAAELCIQLQDAGFVADQALEPCHHLEGASSCSSCSGASCSNGRGHDSGAGVDPQGHHVSEVLADAFKQGCCGMNAPYLITPAGSAYLNRREGVTGRS